MPARPRQPWETRKAAPPDTAGFERLTAARRAAMSPGESEAFDVAARDHVVEIVRRNFAAAGQELKTPLRLGTCYWFQVGYDLSSAACPPPRVFADHPELLLLLRRTVQEIHGFLRDIYEEPVLVADRMWDLAHPMGIGPDGPLCDYRLLPIEAEPAYRARADSEHDAWMERQDTMGY